jgi:HK97 gp10 family phage protein
MAEDFNVKWFGNQVFTLATKVNVEAMKKAAFVVESYVKKHFTKAGMGRLSKRGKKYHRASTAGQPPAIDTGILRASIMSDVTTKALNVIGKVGPDVQHIAAKAPTGTDVNYGLYLELGTAKMAKRPFLRPALAMTNRKVKRIFQQANGK